MLNYFALLDLADKSFIISMKNNKVICFLSFEYKPKLKQSIVWLEVFKLLVV